jgi:hypothetical protein
LTCYDQVGIITIVFAAGISQLNKIIPLLQGSKPL